MESFKARIFVSEVIIFHVYEFIFPGCVEFWHSSLPVQRGAETIWHSNAAMVLLRTVKYTMEKIIKQC